MEFKFEADIKNKAVTDLCSNIFFWDKPEGNNSNEYIRWFILDEQPRKFAGGKPLYTEFDIQVDIYTLGSYKEIEKAIIETLKEKKYTVFQNKNSVERKGNVKLYNKTLRLRFNKYK